MPLGAFFLLLLQVIKRKYQLLNKNIDYETYIIAFWLLVWVAVMVV